MLKNSRLSFKNNLAVQAIFKLIGINSVDTSGQNADVKPCEPLNSEPSAKSVINTLFILARISNLPTVWSNCIAGWLLAGGGDIGKILNLCFGVSCLYIGGMYMNDACDVGFDKIYRPERPIPSGKIKERTVWLISFTLLALGVVSVSHISKGTAFISELLLGVIVLYNTVHKHISFSPVIVGICRLLLYPLGATVGSGFLEGYVLWGGIVLALYVIGFSYIAKYEDIAGYFLNSSIVLIFVPIGLDLIVNDEGYRIRCIIIAVGVIVYLIMSIRHLSTQKPADTQKAVSMLIAGIILIDILAISGISTNLAHYLTVFVFLFVLTLILQKFVPAT